MDVSADLEELGQTQDVMVVCAGAKAILDLKLTLEYLETHGVPVLGYQHQGAARLLHPQAPVCLRGLSGRHPGGAGQDPPSTQHDLGLKGGVLVTNPIPEEYSMDR